MIHALPFLRASARASRATANIVVAIVVGDKRRHVFFFFFFSLSLCHSHSLPHSHTLSYTKEYHRRVSYPQNIDLKLSPPRFSRTLLYSLSRPSLVSRTPGSSPRSTLLFVSRTFCVGLSVSSSRGTVRLPCACVKRDARKSSVKSQSATRERKKTTASKEQRD